MKRHFGFVIGLVLVLMALFNWQALRRVSSQAVDVRGSTITNRNSNSSSAALADQSGQDLFPSQTRTERYGKLPMTFEANQGQTDPAVKFLSHAHGQVLFFSSNETVLVLPRTNALRTRKSDVDASDEMGKRERKRQSGAVVRMKLVNASNGAVFRGIDELQSKTNYYMGSDPGKWRTEVPNYQGVWVDGMYPGVDLHYYGNQGQLEYDFIVRPQADPRAIVLSITGAQKIFIDGNGDLVLSTPVGDIRQVKPFIYQEVDGAKKQIRGDYVVANGNEISFAIGPYDKTKTLIIDPELLYSTYLGGNAGDVADAMGVDSTGCGYIAGTASSVDFPTTSGAYDNNRGDLFYEDAFVTKLNPTGTALIYSTFIGGIYGDDAYAIAVDQNGNAYITGPTGSPDYPTTAAALQRVHAGVDPTNENLQNDDVFVTKLSNQGTLVYSTFIGGDDDDIGFGIAVDNDGNAYVAGGTESSNFRTTPNAFQRVPPTGLSNPYNNGFFLKLTASGSALSYSTYLGGGGLDRALAVAVDDDDVAYVSGSTTSSDFVTTTGRAGTGFLLKIDPVLSGSSSLEYATKVDTAGLGVAVDRLKQAYVAESGFVEKFGADVDETIYKTSIHNAQINAIALDRKGNAFVTGQAFPGFSATPGGAQSGFGGGGGDAFIAKLKATNGGLLYASYLGGGGDDLGFAVAVDLEGKPYITGRTKSDDFPVTPGAFQTSFPQGNGHGNHVNSFVAKFDPAPPPLIFIPGITGTELCDGDSIGPCLWPGLPTTDHRNLSLDPLEKDEVPQNIFPHQVWRGPQGYDSFLRALETNGYRRYDDHGDPQLRTFNGCDLTQRNKNPKLFLLPYDWRRTNTASANSLAGLVQCVRRFYPDSEVNIVTHSMGGLVARRYILDHPDDHYVNKLVTISAPWLGAPKALYILEEGKGFPWYLVYPETIKKIVEFFPSVHQIMPSPSYFQLGGRPFVEDGWDYDKNGVDKETYGFHSQMVRGLNVEHPRSLPGSANSTFYGMAGQEDASQDTSGVDYYSIYGVKRDPDTIVQAISLIEHEMKTVVIDHEAVLYDFPKTALATKMGAGDGTVPLLSLRRALIENDISVRNLNPAQSADDVRNFLFEPRPDQSDQSVEHTGITENPNLQSALLTILKDVAISRERLNTGSASSQPPSPGSATENTSPGALAQMDTGEDPQPDPAYFLTVVNAADVRITDAYGNTDTPLSNPYIQNTPAVTSNLRNSHSVTMVMPAKDSYTLVLTTNSTPMGLEILKGTSDISPTMAVRYHDISLPAGVHVELRMTAQGVNPLRYDLDGDGNFESVVTPTTSVIGNTAADTAAPVVSFSESSGGANTTITISAVDVGSGVKSVHYCLDPYSEAGMRCHEYTGPFQINPDQTPLIFAFAEDNVANRSSLMSYRPRSASRIAFVSDRDGNPEIYTMNADGNGQTRLTNHAALDVAPAWSPDGTKIALVSTRDGNAEVYRMSADGSGATNLTNQAGDDTDPAWSPDGSKIAFSSFRSGTRQIYVMNADGSNQIRLTNNSSNDRWPSWSPDGSRIAFTSDRDGNYEIYSMKVDGSSQVRLTTNSSDDRQPAWSPDGARVVFTATRDGNSEIYTMSSDGSNETRLTDNPAEDQDPAWSSDGTRLTFSSNRDGNAEIYTMNSDGSDLLRLTNNTASDSMPNWHPFSGVTPGQTPSPNPTATPTPTPTPSVTPGPRINVALASNGGSVRASSVYSGNAGYPATAVINGDRKGVNWGNGGGWNDDTANNYPDWIEVDFNGTKDVDELNVFTLQDDYANPIDPTEAMTFSQYGITNYDVQYWNGLSWITVSGGHVTGINLVWKRFAFAPVPTSSIRVLINNSLQSYSRVTEVEAFGVVSSQTVPPPPQPRSRVNVALASNGASASASSVYDGPSGSFPINSINNGDRQGINWGSGGGWNDNTPNDYPDWVEVAFNGNKTISEIDLFTLQDNYGAPVDPTETMTFSQYGLTDFDVQYWNGTDWVIVPNGQVIDNDKVWRRFGFAPLTTNKIRVLINGSLQSYSRITEVEAYEPESGAPTVSLVAPANGASFNEHDNLTLTAAAAANNVALAGVEFFAGANKIGESTSNPYSIIWGDVAAGNYVLTARATDALGRTTTSEAINVTVTGPFSADINVARAANGGTATASSTYDSRFAPAGAIDGDRKGINWGNGGGWNDATADSYPDWLQVDFDGTKDIHEIDLFTVQDNYNSPLRPTPTMTFTQYGITEFTVQYWDGSDWATVPGGQITGNNLIWRRISFATLATASIRVLINASLQSYSRITEVEAYGVASSQTVAPPRFNVALASRGAIVSASSVYSSSNGFPASAVNDGDRRGMNWGSGGGWNDDTSDAYPDWIQIDFNGSKTINEIDTFTLQDNYGSPVEPTEALTFSQYGITDFEVQYWNGSDWTAVPNGSVAGNDRVWRKFTFNEISTSKIRVVINNALAGYSRMTEIEAYGYSAAPTPTPTPTPAPTATPTPTPTPTHTYADAESYTGSIQRERQDRIRHLS